jgi:hypothetical protein
MKEFGGFLLCGSNLKWANKLKEKIQRQLRQERKEGSFKEGKITFGFWQQKKGYPYVQICTGGKEKVMNTLLFLLKNTVRKEKIILFVNNDFTGGRTRKLTPKGPYLERSKKNVNS